MRRFRYWVGYVLRFRSRLIVAPWMYFLLRRFSRRTSFDGIEIVGSLVNEREVEPPFPRDTVAALRLIQAVDPRRYRRVRREIVAVRDAPGGFAASYDPVLKHCLVNYAGIDADKRIQYPEWYQWNYATKLVHEATHGAIFTRHIHYTPKLRARIERLCCTEARRFATRADRTDRRWSEALVPPFDEKRWHDSWHLSVWARLKRHTAYHLEA